MLLKILEYARKSKKSNLIVIAIIMVTISFSINAQSFLPFVIKIISALTSGCLIGIAYFKYKTET